MCLYGSFEEGIHKFRRKGIFVVEISDSGRRLNKKGRNSWKNASFSRYDHFYWNLELLKRSRTISWKWLQFHWRCPQYLKTWLHFLITINPHKFSQKHFTSSTEKLVKYKENISSFLRISATSIKMASMRNDSSIFWKWEIQEEFQRYQKVLRKCRIRKKWT